MKDFLISNIKFSIKNENILVKQFNEWEKFIITDSNSPDINLKIKQCLKFSNDLSFFDFYNESRVKIFYQKNLLITDFDYRNAELIILDNDISNISALANVVFLSYSSLHRTILIHASLVEYNGVGILFIGPSGIGKTTQAELWNKYRNALIINGDMVYVQYCDGQFYGFGSPWHGSSPYCLNRKVPLMGIVALEQGDNNQIQLLNNSQRVSYALKSTFLPSWFPEGYDATFNTMSDLFEKIPVYLLKCRADEEAVSLVEKTIIKNETY